MSLEPHVLMSTAYFSPPCARQKGVFPSLTETKPANVRVSEIDNSIQRLGTRVELNPPAAFAAGTSRLREWRVRYRAQRQHPAPSHKRPT